MNAQWLGQVVIDEDNRTDGPEDHAVSAHETEQLGRQIGKNTRDGRDGSS